VSFVIDPQDVIRAGNSPRTSPGGKPVFVIPRPIDDLRKSDADTLYCSGQATLPDGRVLVVGGAGYQNLGQSNEIEVGVSYGRIFNPDTNSYSLTPESPNGPMWYPTVSQLLSGDMLVTGGFARCCQGDPDANDNVSVYHPSSNTWQRLGLVQNNWITPGIRDYTHVFVLPKPVNFNNLNRHIGMMGYKGLMVYYNTDASTPENQRATLAPNGDRNTGAGTVMAYDSTAFTSPNGAEWVTLGGGDKPWKMDAYNPSTNTWRSLDTRVSRDNAATVLLPDGTVLFINGQNRFDGNQIPTPQIYDPFTNTVTDLPNWTDDSTYRAYHSWGVLLQDGRILLGGGIDNQGHSIACERTDMRIFTPPYLRPLNGGASCVTRPIIIASQPSTILTFQISRSGNNDASANPSVNVSFTNSKLRNFRQASLLRFGSSTHSFDQHQRYVRLDAAVTVQPSGSNAGIVNLKIAAGEAPMEGLYNLFLIGENGVPSVGLLARVLAIN
jgi:hypothetical protein